MNHISKFFIIVCMISSTSIFSMQDGDKPSQCSRWDTLKARMFSDTVAARNKKMADIVSAGNYTDESLPYLQALLCANKSLISRRRPAQSYLHIRTQSTEDTNYTTPYRALEYSVRLGRMSAVKAFMQEFDFQPMANGRDSYRLMASAMPSAEMTKFLLKSDLDLKNIQQSHNDNPLFKAEITGDVFLGCDVDGYPYKIDWEKAPGYPYFKAAYDKAISAKKTTDSMPKN